MGREGEVLCILVLGCRGIRCQPLDIVFLSFFRIRRVWQKRKCGVKYGCLTISHSMVRALPCSEQTGAKPSLWNRPLILDNGGLGISGRRKDGIQRLNLGYHPLPGRKGSFIII